MLWLVLLILLKALLWTLVGLLGLLLLVLLAILFVPITFTGWLDAHIGPDEESELGYSGKVRWKAAVNWGYLLVRFRAEGSETGLTHQRLQVLGIPFGSRRKRSTGDGPKGKKADKPKPKKAKTRSSFNLEKLRLYVREGSALLARVWEALHLRLNGSVHFGLEDPADTGLLLGLLWAVGLPRQVPVQADFVNPRLEGELDLRGRVWGYQLAAALWIAFWNLPIGPRRWLRFKAWLSRKPMTYVGG